MERVPPEKSSGSFLLALGLTSLVVVLPCMAAIALRLSGMVSSPVLLIAIPVLASILASHGIAEFWKRRRSGSPLLFEDLMLWGWFRRRRFERLLARSEDFVGVDAGRGLSPARRARELERLAGALEARDPRTHGHSRRVARHATQIAKALKLEDPEVSRIRTAALLHDVGKIEVPREILEKPGALDDAEFARIQMHSVAGERMVGGMGDPELASIVRHHHERIDGGGYPDGISADEIPIGARVIAVADTFDALTSARSYRQPSSHEEALGVLREQSGTQLDPDAVRAFDGRYSSRRPVALLAVILGLGRQAGQSMISFGTGASQVVAVGAAAAVIGAAPVGKDDHQQKAPGQPAIVKEAGAGTAVASGSTDSGTVAAEVSQEAKPRAKRQIGNQPARGINPGSGADGAGQTSDGESESPTGDGGGGGGGSGTGSGGSATGSSTGGGGSSGASTGGSNTATNPVKTLTEVAQKQVQQTTQQITDSIPTLPGNDPVSQGVNDSVTGVKDTIGKLTGKP